MEASDDGQFAVLAIDLGTGGPKAAVVDAAGRTLGYGVATTPISHSADGGAEQDPEDWWRAIVAAARDALAAQAAGTPRPGAVAVTAQWVTTVPIDSRGAAVGHAISWMDTRGAPFARRACGPGPRVAGYNAGKLVRWLRITGGAPSLDGRDPVGQILFLRHERPDVYAAADYFVEPGDYLTARMTGKVVTAAETATACWGTDTRNIAAISYHDGALAMSGLDPGKLAPIVPTGAAAGELLAGPAAELGLEPGIPVLASTPDITSAAVGSGAVGDREAHLYAGTSGWLACHLPQRRADALHQVASLPSSLPGRYLIACEQQCVGATLDHLRDRLLAAPQTPYPELMAEAQAAGIGSGGVQFTPWLNGERSPLDDSRLRGAYSNLSLTSDRGALVRATLEGVAFNMRWLQRYTERLARSRHDSIAFIGGGAMSELWSQIFADVLGREIRQIAEPRQANVRGAALLALISLGRITAGQVPGLVGVERTFTPDPVAVRQYDALFKDFQAYHKATKKWHARRNAPEA